MQQVVLMPSMTPSSASPVIVRLKPGPPLPASRASSARRSPHVCCNSVELTAILQRTRAGEDWATNVGAQAKSILAPTALGQFGIAVTAGATFNVMTGQDTTSFVNVPMSFKLHDLVQLNANVGWLHSEDHHFTWGAGLEWEFRKPWTLLAEVFGETGKMGHPRGQLGLR